MPIFAPKLILAATDFSESSVEALRYAARLASAFQSELLLLHAQRFEPPAYFTESQRQDLAQQIDRSKASTYNQLAAQARHLTGSPAREPLLLEAEPVDAILATAAKQDAGLIVMGSHGRSGWNRLMMGSVAEKVMRQAKTPLMIVRSRPGNASGDIKRILCPVDFSESALAALQHAAALAGRLEAELSVLHVVETGVSEEAERMRLCEWVPQQLRSRCRVKDAVVHGNAEVEIVRAAGALPASLVVLGIEHKAFFDTTVIGTTAVRITRHSPSPVLTVPLPGK